MAVNVLRFRCMKLKSKGYDGLHSGLNEDVCLLGHGDASLDN